MNTAVPFQALVVLGWFLAAVCNLSVLYGLYEVARGNNLSPSISALYGSVNRIAWGIGVAWVILACATGNGGRPIIGLVKSMSFWCYQQW